MRGHFTYRRNLSLDFFHSYNCLYIIWAEVLKNIVFLSKIWCNLSIWKIMDDLGEAFFSIWTKLLHYYITVINTCSYDSTDDLSFLYISHFLTCSWHVNCQQMAVINKALRPHPDKRKRFKQSTSTYFRRKWMKSFQ